MKQKTCFVISPIGKEGTDIRKNSDDLLDLIILPAVEKYDFKVIRGDQIPGPSIITEDIIDLVQNSDLCIIDLTGRNPNVYYECGRRHETAKPYIQIKRKEEDLPFDVAGIRTIDYDLSDGRTIRNSVEKIRTYVDEMEFKEYATQPTGISLTSLANSLDRIERKLDNVGQKPATSSSTDVHGNPVQIYTTAINDGNYILAANALKKYMRINKNYNLLLDMASPILKNYEIDGVDIVTSMINDNFNDISSKDLGLSLFELYDFYRVALSLSDKKEYLFGLADKTLKRDGIANEDKARMVNVKASIEYSLNNLEESIALQKQTIELNPTEVVYYYNLAKSFEAQGKTEDSISYLDKMIEIHNQPGFTNPYIPGLEYAEKIYKKYGHNAKVDEIDKLKTKTYK